MSSQTYEVIRGTVVLVLCLAAIGWFLWLWLKKTRDPALLIFRWILTVAAFCGIGYGGRQAGIAYSQGSPAAIFGVFYGAVGGLFLAIVWLPPFVDYVSRTIGSLYTGGDTEPEPRPFYSVFHAKRTNGKYFEALAEVRRQLDEIPDGF